MQSNQIAVDVQILTVLRRGGMSYDAAVKLIAEHVTDEDRVVVAPALDEWGIEDRIQREMRAELLARVEEARRAWVAVHGRHGVAA